VNVRRPGPLIPASYDPGHDIRALARVLLDPANVRLHLFAVLVSRDLTASEGLFSRHLAQGARIDQRSCPVPGS
jgi:hypothetical protein